MAKTAAAALRSDGLRLGRGDLTRGSAREPWVPAGLIVALVWGATGVAHAGPDHCEGLPSLSTNPTLSMGRIVGGVPRVHFVKGAAEAKGCPGATDACRAQAFLVPGNRVILGQTQGAFVCADYVAATGAERAGWLPVSSVARDITAPIGVADWTGLWSRTEASIAIKPAALSGALRIDGDATWGALDPQRVKRGAINVGNITGVVTPVGSGLGFTMGDDRTLPVTEGEPETDCRVWMRRLGPHLLVDDNNRCGGMNVTFRGVYIRKP